MNEVYQRPGQALGADYSTGPMRAAASQMTQANIARANKRRPRSLGEALGVRAEGLAPPGPLAGPASRPTGLATPGPFTGARTILEGSPGGNASLYDAFSMQNSARSVGPRSSGVDEGLQAHLNQRRMMRPRVGGTQMNSLPGTSFGDANPGIASNDLARAKARGGSQMQMGELPGGGSRELLPDGRVSVVGRPLMGRHVSGSLRDALEGEGYQQAPLRPLVDRVRAARSNERIRAAGGVLPRHATLPEAMGLQPGTGMPNPQTRLSMRLQQDPSSATVAEQPGGQMQASSVGTLPVEPQVGNPLLDAARDRRRDRLANAREMQTQMAQDRYNDRRMAQQQAMAQASDPMAGVVNSPMMQNLMLRSPEAGAGLLAQLFDSRIKRDQLAQQGQQFGMSMANEQSMLAEKLGVERERLGYQSPLDQARVRLTDAQAAQADAERMALAGDTPQTPLERQLAGVAMFTQMRDENPEAFEASVLSVADQAASMSPEQLAELSQQGLSTDLLLSLRGDLVASPFWEDQDETQARAAKVSRLDALLSRLGQTTDTLSQPSRPWMTGGQASGARMPSPY